MLVPKVCFAGARINISPRNTTQSLADREVRQPNEEAQDFGSDVFRFSFICFSLFGRFNFVIAIAAFLAGYVVVVVVDAPLWLLQLF